MGKEKGRQIGTDQVRRLDRDDARRVLLLYRTFLNVPVNHLAKSRAWKFSFET
jgi:hypothetical protein